MFNKALFKMEWQSNYKFLILFMAILSLYNMIMISMFDPDLGSALDEFAKAMPEIMALIGMDGSPTTLIGFIANYLYGFIMIVFPLLYSTIIIVRLIVRKVDNGSMTYLLSCGNARMSVVFTQFCVWISGLFLLMAYVVALDAVWSMMLFDNALDVEALFSLNTGMFFLQATMGAIVFVCSCIFNEVKTATLFGAGIPVVFILMQMLGNMGGNLENFKYATILTLFDTEKLIAMDMEGYLMAGVLALMSAVFIAIGAIVFKKKSMSL